jgi:hypothetical protein
MTYNINCVLAVLILTFFLSAQAVADELPASTDTITAEHVLVDLTTMSGIGGMTTLGVAAKAYVTAVDPETDGESTHEVVVTFANEKTGALVKKALVGIKQRRLFGAASKPVWMKSSKDQPELFKAYVSLKKRGTYLFIVGSNLEYNKTRQFTFQYSY